MPDVSRAYGLPVVIARVFMVYGPEQKDRRKLVPYCILKALKGKHLNYRADYVVLIDIYQ